MRIALLTVVLSIAVSSPVPMSAAAAPADSPRTAAVDARVNINTADVKELMKLSGVGRGLAEKIVQYRDAHGPFKKAGDLVPLWMKSSGHRANILNKGITEIGIGFGRHADGWMYATQLFGLGKK